MTSNIGWMIVLVGLMIVAIGLTIVFGPSIPWLGRLPGDIVIERGRSRFYFPIVTCLLISVILTLASWLARWLTR